MWYDWILSTLNHKHQLSSSAELCVNDHYDASSEACLMFLWTADIHSLLDVAKIADSLIFVLDPTEGWDSYGEYVLSCLFAQGLPSYGECHHWHWDETKYYVWFLISDWIYFSLLCMFSNPFVFLSINTHPVALVCQGVSDLPMKKKIECRRALSKVTEVRFPDARLFLLDSEQDATLLLRHLGTQRQRKLGFRSRRSHLLAQQVTFTPNSPTEVLGGGPTGLGTLCVSGYVRGRPLRVDRLVHITGHGDFQLNQIDAPLDPLPLHITAPRPAKPGKEGDVDMQVGNALNFFIKL